MRRWFARGLRDPLLWFACGAVALFGVYRLIGGDGPRIEVSAATQAALVDDYTTLSGHPPSAAERAKIIHRYVDDEVLFQEALKRGIHLSDRSIRERMIERMRMALAPQPAEPSEDDLLAFYAAHASAYVAEPAISFDQVYFARPPADPAAMLARLRGGERIAGDDFWMGRQMPRYGESMISGMFGMPFLQALRTSPLGQWQGPILSLRGAHFVRVTARVAPVARSYADVRDLVRQDWITAQANKALESQMQALRHGYTLQIAGENRPATSNTP